MSPYRNADGSAVRILIVDDEHDNRELMQIMLDWEGFHTTIVASGVEALAAVEDLPPQLVLLDLMMPDMDGYEVVSRLKGKPSTKHIPVMIVSAMNDKASKRAAFAAGADDFLSKPMNRLELCERVKKLVAAAREPAQPLCSG